MHHIYISFLALILSTTFHLNAMEGFAGVMLDEDTLAEASAKVSGRGYEVVAQRDDSAIFSGRIAGQESSIALVPNSNGAVGLILILVYGEGFEKPFDSYAKLDACYTRLYTAMVANRGEPEAAVTAFAEPYDDVNGDFEKLGATRMGFLTQIAVWQGDKPNDGVILKVEKSCMIKLTYMSNRFEEERQAKINKSTRDL